MKNIILTNQKLLILQDDININLIGYYIPRFHGEYSHYDYY